jgi:hypothetical protein
MNEPWLDFQQKQTETGMPWEDFKTAAVRPSFGENLKNDVIDIGKNIIPSMGQSLSNVGKMGMDILTGASIRDIVNPVKSTNPVASAINEPTIKNIVRGTQEESVKEAPNYSSVGAIKETLYNHPLKNEFVNAAMLAAPMFSKTAGNIEAPKGFDILKNPVRVAKNPKPVAPVVVPKPVDMIDTAEVLPTTLEKTNIQNIANNRFVRDNTQNFIGKQAPEIAKEAADQAKQIKPAIREAQNQFYKKLGIKDSDPVESNLALAKMKHELGEASKYLDESQIAKARKIYEGLTAQTDTITKKPIISKVAKNFNPANEGSIPEYENAITGYEEIKNVEPLTFGKAKEASRILYDLAEDNVTPLGRKTLAGKFYTRMANALTEAKRNDPRIAKAADQYVDLMDAEHLINKTLRLNREMGEMRLESKIASSYKDKGQLTFKENLQKLHDTLAKYPETQKLVSYGGFTDKIKLAQLANDIATKKTVAPIGMGRIPGVKMIGNVVKVGNPEFHAQLLARGIENGWVKPEAVSGKVPNYHGLITGTGKTRYGAIKSILQFPKGAKQ